MRPRRLAFTMLELLVVISIMAILSAMILVGASAIMGNAERKKTETIIQTVKTGIELAIANKGSAISPTEHPFAGSNAESGGGRFKFVRGSGNAAWGTNVSTTGTALKGVPNPDFLNGSQDQLMMLSDRFEDERIVLLHGTRREDIGVLQSLRKVVTKYRLLPMPPKPASPTTPRKVISPKTGIAESSYTDLLFPDTMIPSLAQMNDTTYGRLSDTKPALDYLFGNSSAQAELASLKALYNADPTLPEDQNPFRTGVEQRTVASTNGASVTEPLVYSNVGTGGNQEFRNFESKWKPGYIPISSSGTTRTLESAGSSNWARYRLAGLAVYDAWNNELMTVTGGNNSYRVISAGKDGALAIQPGKDNHIDTTSITVDTAGKLQVDAKDLDGAKDNLQ